MNPLLTRRKLLGLLAALLPARAPATMAGLFNTNHFFGRFRVPKQPLGDYVSLYLNKHPDETNPRLLEQVLFGSSFPGDERAKKASISKKIANDFVTDDTVILDGWILSRTEIRLWAWMYELYY